METTPNQIQANLPRLGYSRTEAAKILGVTPASVDRLAKRGLLRPSRGLRRPLYSLAELERFLRETAPSV